MTQSALARFEAGGTVPTLALLERIAQALDAHLVLKSDRGKFGGLGRLGGGADGMVRGRARVPGVEGLEPVGELG